MCVVVASNAMRGMLTLALVAAPFYRQISRWLADEKEPFIPNRVKIMPNGLDDVAEGLALLLDKKVHGEKLVYRIADTPGIKA